MKIRLMHLIGSMSYGGAQKLTKYLVEGLYRKSFEISLCCLERGGPYAEELAKQGYEVTILGEGLGDNCTPSRVLRLFIRTIHLLRVKRPHILHTHLALVSLFGLCCGKLTGVPIIVSTLHRIEYPFLQRRSAWLQSLLTNAFIVDSHAVVQLLSSEVHLPRSKFIVAYNGIDTDYFDVQVDANMQRKLLGILPEAKVVGIVAHLFVEKGYPNLLCSFRQIVTQEPNALLLIVGDGYLRPSLERQAFELGIADRVRFLGERGDLRELLSVMDVVVLPSSWEGFGIILAEAMYMRIPVVATNRGGATEVVEDGVTGFLTTYGDEAELASVVMKLLMDTDLACRLGKQGRERVKRLFTKQIMLKRYDAIYRELAQQEKLS